MIDYRKLNDKIIVHCENEFESTEFLTFLGYRYSSSKRFRDVGVRLFNDDKGLDFCLDAMDSYVHAVSKGEYYGYSIIEFKDILVPDKLTRFKNTLEVKLNDR